ncbi:MAG TPA: TonB-dependent receptor [Opitutaceae bacterium]|jgi:TonB-dependent receptor|nr:TonB-dependent receptor [Opitutaceae bacterium]HRE05461.1 TonB-dependent receptor [Opitutaceae bacterium]
MNYLPLSSARLSSATVLRLIGAIALGLVLLVSVVSAQEVGVLEGTVTDARGGFLAGAEVRISGGQLTATTSTQGLYRITGVTAGEHSLQISYLGLADYATTVTIKAGAATRQDAVLKSDVVELDAFVVESIRAGQSRAINQQRTSNTISNIISADAIGNLPDNTIADALTRLPGVSVVVEGGSAAYASIRGAEAKLNSVTLDGQRITATPSGSGLDASNSADTRAVDLSLIPSELVGGIELIKALTPDKDADSLGGAINLVTRSAYDLKERSINGKFEYLHNDFGNQDGYSASFSYSDVLNKAGTVGISATLTYRDQDSIQDDTEILYYLPTNAAVSAIPAVGAQGIEEYDVRSRPQSRQTLGGTFNLDWKLGDRTELHFRTLYNASDLEETRYRTRMRGLLRWNATSTAALASGAEARIGRRLEDVTRTQDIRRLGLEGITRTGGGDLSYGLTYGSSSFDGDRIRTTFEYSGSTVRRAYDWTVDRSDPQFPRVKITHRATGENGLLRPQDMTLVQYRNQYSDEKDVDWVGNLDYAFDREIAGRPVKWKVGAKYRGKDRTSRPTLIDLNNTGAALTEANFGVQTGPVNRILGTVPTMGNFASLSEVIAFTRANPTRFVEVIAGEQEQTRNKVYDAAEDVTAAYAMGSTKFGKLEAIAGVRYESTDLSYTWLTAPGGPKKGGSNYGNVYPSVVFNYRQSKNLVMRLAVTNTLARPDYADLVPFETLEDPESGDTEETPPALIPIFRGNSNLKAQESTNFDLSFEWYYEPSGVFSVSLFKKDVSSFIYRSQTLERIGTQDYIVLQQRNGGKQDLNGVEISWQQSFSRLPAPFDGFGINANATFVDGDSTYTVINPTNLGPKTIKEDFVPNQAKKVYNLQLYWEKYGFTARAGLNFTDTYVRDVGGIVDNVINDAATRVDALVSYQLTNNVTLYVEGKNLTDEVKSWYNGDPSRPEEFEHVGWTGIAGVKWRF